jgi:hypothetical protein
MRAGLTIICRCYTGQTRIITRGTSFVGFKVFIARTS